MPEALVECPHCNILFPAHAATEHTRQCSTRGSTRVTPTSPLPKPDSSTALTPANVGDVATVAEDQEVRVKHRACGVVMTRAEFEQHRPICPAQRNPDSSRTDLVRCVHATCPALIPKDELEVHSLECGHRPATHELCGTVVTARELPAHVIRCSVSRPTIAMPPTASVCPVPVTPTNVPAPAPEITPQTAAVPIPEPVCSRKSKND